MINCISLEGFKGFKDKTDFEIKNLTLLFGYNNSGKSALIRALPLLSDSFKYSEQVQFVNTYIDYRSKALRGAEFSGILHDESLRIGYGVKWEDGDELFFETLQNALEDEELRNITLTKDGVSKTYKPGAEERSIFESDDKSVLRINSLAEISDDKFAQKLNEMSKSVFWISSLRAVPPREFDIGVGINVGISPNGEGVGETLWYLNQKHPDVLEFINLWLVRLTGRRLSLNSRHTSSSSSQGKIRARLATDRTESDSAFVDVLDSGEGVAQVLPVLTQCAMAKFNLLVENPIVAIEQPELHLHPKAIVQLAKFIVTCVTSSEKVKIIIETHSESFLVAIQQAVLDREISPLQLKSYWVYRTNGSSFIDEIEIDESGYIDDTLPQEVFREVLEQSRELVKSRESKEA